MAFQPGTEEINNLIAFTEVGYEQAVILLRVSSRLMSTIPKKPY